MYSPRIEMEKKIAAMANPSAAPSEVMLRPKNAWFAGKTVSAAWARLVRIRPVKPAGAAAVI